MQIVINIPKVMYINAKRDLLFGTDILVNAIKNGAPLPKGHGRLGDLDALEKEIEDYSEGAFAMTPEFLVKHAPTIIEADKESD